MRVRACCSPPQTAVPPSPSLCPRCAPTGLVCYTAAIQQEQELPGSCAQVSRLGTQVRAEAQHQHRVQQDVLMEASLQEPHLNMGPQSHSGPGLVQLQPGWQWDPALEPPRGGTFL